MGRGICLGDGIWTVRKDEYDRIVAMPNGWQSPCKGENIKQARKQTQEGYIPNRMRLSVKKCRVWISRRGHTTCTQDEANREEGRASCGCVVVAIVVEGFGGDRGRRGG